MFKFDFDFQESQTDADSSSQNITETHGTIEKSQDSEHPPFVSLNIQDLVEELPPLISYSPLKIPASRNNIITLLRRDLFDARFQLISEDKASKDLDFIDAPSDLVPGVYEGGLKTWECSADLAGYLDSVDIFGARRSYKIIEVGCGTAIPSLSILQKVFTHPLNDPKDEGPMTTLHLQDYNSTVLQLVTVPNIILTWCIDADVLIDIIKTYQDASPASTSYRTSQSLPTIDVSEPGELAISPELVSAFLASLRERCVKLEFFSGAWSDLEARIRETKVMYDLTLTSETIYRSASVPSLISLLRAACTPQDGDRPDVPPSTELATLSIGEESVSRRCLVAAKVIYFGVGGGIDEFERLVKEAGAGVDMVFEKKAGVGRRIVSVDWDHFA